MTLISGDLKCYCVLPVKIGAYESQVINCTLARLTHSESYNPSSGYFLSSGMYTWNRSTQQLVESPYYFHDLWNEGHYNSKGQVEATRTALTQENSKPKQYTIPGEITELSASTKDLTLSGVVIPTISSFTYLASAENRCIVCAKKYWGCNINVVYSDSKTCKVSTT